MATILYPADLCPCCALKAANDDTTGCEANCGPDSHPQPLLSRLELAPGDTVVIIGEDEFFTWSRCDGCNGLAGDRLAAQVIA